VGTIVALFDKFMWVFEQWRTPLGESKEIPCTKK